MNLLCLLGFHQRWKRVLLEVQGLRDPLHAPDVRFDLLPAPDGEVHVCLDCGTLRAALAPWMRWTKDAQH